MKPTKHKTIKHYHEPGDVHELTFSCYQQLPILTNHTWRGYLARAIDAACTKQHWDLVAFVFMPDHVHLLGFPIDPKPDIGAFLAGIKRTTSDAVKADLEKYDSPLLARLTVRERPGKHCFRYWQEGPGYDRNLQGPTSVKASMDYLHLNPVRRKLVTRASLWKWSSAAFYESDVQLDADLPRITPLPAEFWNLPS